MIVAIHRLDFKPAQLIFPQHIERHSDPGAAIRPDYAIEIGQILCCITANSDDEVASPHSGLLGGAARRDASDDQLSSSSVVRPSHGRAGSHDRPAAMRSAAARLRCASTTLPQGSVGPAQLTVI